MIIALHVAEHLLRIQLTVIEGFRSHLEALWLIKPNQLQKQVVILVTQIISRGNDYACMCLHLDLTSLGGLTFILSPKLHLDGDLGTKEQFQ